MTPLKFNAEMKRAYEEGRKTQTRRIIKPQPQIDYFRQWWSWGEHYGQKKFVCSNTEVIEGLLALCPYGEVGDIKPIYDENGVEFGRVEITGKRAERVQDISEADAWAEGCRALHYDAPLRNHTKCIKTAREEFKNLWNSIHGPDAWKRNDWVWVIEFKKVEV